MDFYPRMLWVTSVNKRVTGSAKGVKRVLFHYGRVGLAPCRGPGLRRESGSPAKGRITALRPVP